MLISLVAERDGGLIGQALFSRLVAPCPAAALAPVSVAAAERRRGIGDRLIRAGLRRLGDDGVRAVIVLGDPAYYGRFGFRAELAAGFASPYAGPHLMALALRGDLPRAGEIVHAAAFARL